MMRQIFVSLAFLMYANIAFAYVTENITGGCIRYPSGVRAVFMPHEHTCAAGYYLPANYDGCVACPQNATCTGGTFQFSERVASGITYARPITANISRGCNANLSGVKVARFTVNEYDCAAGEYVPANNDGCVPCPADSYCPGGHYMFNKTENQGITACATGLYAPTGMWESAQCGHILHIGENVLYLRSTKKTPHALHFAVDGNGGLFFANATTADVPIHAETNRRLKIKFNDVIYSIYDDTVNVNE